jgi:hypothetical protein
MVARACLWLAILSPIAWWLAWFDYAYDAGLLGKANRLSLALMIFSPTAWAVSTMLATYSLIRRNRQQRDLLLAALVVDGCWLLAVLSMTLMHMHVIPPLHGWPPWL